MSMRLSLDMGSTSLGWCLLHFGTDGQPLRIIDGGVRIFDNGRDPKSDTPNAVARREARSARRRRDRYVRRRAALMRELVAYGLMPKDEVARKALETFDPYVIRQDCLDREQHPYHVGRALFHLNQRRGFKSNRKAERKADDDLGAVGSGHERLNALMADAGARTYGDLMAMRMKAGLNTRIRRDDIEGDGKDYDFYPSRAHLEFEFGTIWEAQACFNPEVFTETARDHLFDVIFFQRPLKAPKVGKCSYSEEERLHRAHPLFQKFRLLKELNELYIVTDGEGSAPLTLEQRETLLRKMRGKKAAAFKTLESALKLAGNQRFNKHSENRTKLEGNVVEAEMLKRYGPGWDDLGVDQQAELIDHLLQTEDPKALFDWLSQEHGLVGERAESVANCPLPESHGRLGHSVTADLIDELERAIIPESKAIENLGLHHSDRRDGQAWDRLPYYGAVSTLSRMIPPGSEDADDPEEIRLGKITNPTVHIALNQVRRLVNAVIDKYGKPDRIHVEMARDLKQSDRQKADGKKQNTANRKAAEARSRLLQELGQRDTGRNRARLALWEDLHPDPKSRCCPYSGEPIGPSRLFTSDIDIDHILPFSKTYDDSNANKTVCLRDANRLKKNRTPAETWFGTDQWDGIAARASFLPGNKRWRFQPDAMERFEEDGGFEARQLNDTRYMSRVALTYLAALYGDEKGVGSQHVYALPGRLTALLRRKWGLNDMLPDALMADEQDLNIHQPKNRMDHRHHFIDAYVIGLSDAGLLKRISTLAARNVELEASSVMKNMPDPYSDFRDDLQRQLDQITVYHRPRHRKAGGMQQSKADKGRTKGYSQTAGKLHLDTAYGNVPGDKDFSSGTVRHRISLMSFKTGKNLTAIQDDQLRGEIEIALHGLTTDKEREAALKAFRKQHPHYKGIRRVRITENLNVLPIKDADGRAYKGYKGGSNFSYQIWQNPDGKWKAHVISMFDAHHKDFTGHAKDRHPAAKFIMELRQNDMIKIDDPKLGSMIVRVVKFGQNGQIFFAAHQEAGSLQKRDTNKNDPFKYISKYAGTLQAAKARRLLINELGHVYDPLARKAGEVEVAP